MEFYGYPTLAEVMLYWNLPSSLWISVFERMSGILNLFKQRPAAQVPAGVWREMYAVKVRGRVEEYLSSLAPEISARLTGGKLSLNGTELSAWPDISRGLDRAADSLANTKDFVIVHGDFCFNNILCEPYMGLVKLLDPRGSFGAGAVGIYGDRKYDWAKLGHSVVGRYDYIVNDLFHLEGDGREFEMQIFDRDWQSDLEGMFWDQCEKEGLDFKQISFIMGTLFLSMTPLHRGQHKRQLAFFLTGLKFMTEASAH
jgi:hypothetical protein